MAKDKEKEKNEKPVDKSGETVDKKVKEAKEKKEDTVTITREELDAFLNRLSSLEDDNKKLIQAADKGRMARAQQNAGGVLIRRVKVSRFGRGGKIIVKWEMKVNEAYAQRGQIFEKQIVELTFEDGETQTVELVDFYRKQNKETFAEIKGKKIDENGEETLNLILEDGKEIEIGLAYVN